MARFFGLLILIIGGYVTYMALAWIVEGALQPPRSRGQLMLPGLIFLLLGAPLVVIGARWLFMPRKR